jgi:hypothetical protein
LRWSPVFEGACNATITGTPQRFAIASACASNSFHRSSSGSPYGKPKMASRHTVEFRRFSAASINCASSLGEPAKLTTFFLSTPWRRQ